MRKYTLRSKLQINISKQRRRVMLNKYNRFQDKYEFGIVYFTQNNTGSRTMIFEDLSKLVKHMENFQIGLKHCKLCEFFVKTFYSICGICIKALHIPPTKIQHKGDMWFFDYHNDTLFGIYQGDIILLKTISKNCKYPPDRKIIITKGLYTRFRTIKT